MHTLSRLRRNLAWLTRELFSQAPHQVEFCQCCDGDGRLRRCAP